MASPAASDAGVIDLHDLDLLAEKEYLDILNALPKGNQQLDDSDPDKFIAQMGAEAIYTLLQRVDLDELSYSLRHKASTETSLKTLNQRWLRALAWRSKRCSSTPHRWW